MAKISESRENLLGSVHNVRYGDDSISSEAIEESLLTPTEKKFLLFAERGDVATVRRLIEDFVDSPDELRINCVDPLNRSALVTAIENENIELVRLLLDKGIKVKDALLHAIKEEYVEGVEVLLEWEEQIHQPGQPYSWEAVDRSSSAFTTDITPLILAAHMNHYEILKILLDRGATLPSPHDVRCGCDDCLLSSSTDSLRHSQSRINAYRALSASSLIALSSRDPLLTAFELSWELRRLSFCETEFRQEYKEMRGGTQDFATALLDHARTSLELEVMLNFNLEEGEIWEPGDRQTLDRLKLAIKYKQKKFVAHPNVQQLLASIWYDGLPGFRRKSMPLQLLEVARLGCMFPVYSTIYMLAPNSQQGQFMKKPFVKFICHSSSYAFFLMLLGLASQRAEYLVIEWFGPAWMQEILADWKRRERGSLPGLVECALVIYIFSWIFGEVKSLWNDGLLEYIGDLWNIVDFITNCFYMLWICLRFTSIFIVRRDLWNGIDPYYPRERWHPFDPMLLSEGAFAAGMIFSFLKLVHIFSVNPHLGPLQISLGRMIIDILKFFFIYTLVLFAFGCGMNQLMWYYADLEKKKCYVLSDPDIPDFDGNDKACSTWRRFANLFETSQSLFWASFGLVDLTAFDLQGIKSFTRFWALLLFGSYSVINIIVLLNMLIAMMSNSYQIIQERSDVEWKFARSRLWISYFDEGDTLPAPFNLMPTMKNVMRMFGLSKKVERKNSVKVKSKVKAQERHDTVMRLLVRRFVMAEQTKRDDFGITEDDVMEIRQDISTLRYELVDILRTNGMKTPNIKEESNAVSKKGKVMERRLVKDFQIGLVEGLVNEVLKNEKEPKDVFSKIANVIGRRTSSNAKKKDWNAIVRKSTMRADPIGRKEEMQDRRSRQSIRRYIIEKNNETMDPERLVEYNPRLSEVAPAMRVAYAKFKLPKIKQEFAEVDKGERADSVDERKGGITDGAVGDDDVFKGSALKKSPTPSGSIARPRPRSSGGHSIKSLVPSTTSQQGSRQSSIHEKVASVSIVNEVQSAPDTSSDDKPAPTTSEDLKPETTAEAKDFRSRTPIPEDPRENAPTPEPFSETTEKPVEDIKVTMADEKEEKIEDEPKQEESKEGEESEAKSCGDEKPADVKKKDDKDDDQGPVPIVGQTKASGKSVVSGQILTGWL